jgi:hypothetical protein
MRLVARRIVLEYSECVFEIRTFDTKQRCGARVRSTSSGARVYPFLQWQRGAVGAEQDMCYNVPAGRFTFS